MLIHPNFSSEKIDKEYFAQNLKSLDADMAIVVAFGQILSKEILAELKFGWINIHYSLSIFSGLKTFKPFCFANSDTADSLRSSPRPLFRAG